MSYDIYCYRSKTGIPDQEEADLVIEADNDKWGNKDRDANTKLSIVNALTNYDPRLEAFVFDYGELAKLTDTTSDEARNMFDHIELNTREGDISVQLTVYDNHVFITVPYWYKGEDANRLFQALKTYIQIIRETAGYFVFDPQSGHVFDPAENGFDGLKKYLSVSENSEEIVGKENTKKSLAKKPWWKIWK